MMRRPIFKNLPLRCVRGRMCCLVSVMCAAMPLLAEESGEVIDTLKTYELQNVQVTSTRAGKNTPMAFSMMRKGEIQGVNLGQDLPSLLSTSPSVTWTSDAGNGIGYTSMRVRGTDPSRINITANGIPMNDAESATLFWVNMSDFASSLESVQIQRGVGTSTNGPGAFGGTVNMQTENIGMKPYLGVDLSAGSYLSHKETVRFGTGLIADHWGFQGRLSNLGSKGYLQRASTKLDSYFLQGGYFSDRTMVKFITFNNQEETYHAWNYASKYEQRLYGRTYNSCGEYYDKDGNQHYYENQTDYYHQQNYQLIWEQVLSDKFSLSAALHYTKGFGYYEEYKAKRTLAEYNLTTDFSLLGDLVRRKNMDNDFYGFIASLSYDDHKTLKAVLGGGWNKYDGDHIGNVLWTGDAYREVAQPDGTTVKDYNTGALNAQPDFEYYKNNAKKTDMNIYYKVSWQFVPEASAFVDLQYRHIGYKMHGPESDWDWETGKQVEMNVNDCFNFFNPKFGLNYDFLKGHRLYASFSIAQKEPTRNDYQDHIGQKMKAEKLNDLEIGYKYQSPKFSAGLNFYYMYYRNQFVLTGELNEIGEMIASNDNSGKSYRMGLEGEMAWKPVDFFRWDMNLTWSHNRAKNWTVTLDDGETQSLGDTPLSFSPDFILNNAFTLTYKGFDAVIRSRYVGEQYLTNTGFKSYLTQDDDGKDVNVGMMLCGAFTTDVSLNYHFQLKALKMKDATVGVTFYNIFSKKYDNNGWAAPSFKKDGGKVIAYTDYDQYEAGFAPSAPFNFMAHLSVNF